MHFPPTFTIEFKQIGCLTYKLMTSLVLPLPREAVFNFFEDPGNLFEITPDWLDFKMANININEKTETFEGVEFAYTIKWLGLRLKWKSKIIDYKPPERFIDIQLKGPYRFWQHLHIFEEVPEGTLMKDEVTYKLHFASKLFHPLIKRQLHDIFSYRALRIAKWASGEFKPKLRNKI
jgi:ligand-binding SRPBCC domain-containing protein